MYLQLVIIDVVFLVIIIGLEMLCGRCVTNYANEFSFTYLQYIQLLPESEIGGEMGTGAKKSGLGQLFLRHNSFCIDFL